MTETTTPKRHDTKSPLTCCPRCYKAELAGRARNRPVFRYEKAEAAERPSTYDVFHGNQHIATLSRRSASGPTTYEVRVASDEGDVELEAPSLRDARTMAEDTYTAAWREGRGEAARGPVREL